MSRLGGDEDLILRYLLADLTEEEKTRLEIRYFEDDNFLNRILVEEAKLTERYLRCDLSIEERKRFEQHFLAANTRRRALVRAQARKSISKSKALSKIGNSLRRWCRGIRAFLK